MRRKLLLPLIILALGLAAAGGVAGAAMALTSNGGGDDESHQSAVATPQEESPGDKDASGANDDSEVAYLGVVLGESRGEEGALVLRVGRGSPAADAGIEREDVITAVGGEAVDEPGDVVDAVKDAAPGDELTLTISASGGRGDEREVTVTLGERPHDLDELIPGLPRELPGLREGKLLPNLRPFRGALLGRLFVGPERLLERFVSGEITFLNDEGEVETVRAVAGTVESVDQDELVLSPKDGGSDEHFELSDETRVWKFIERGELGDIEEGDEVIVVTKDGGEAVAVVILEAPQPEESS